MQEIRHQLTLFVNDDPDIIERVRAIFNPVQHGLIAAHITLCRENEITNLDQVLANIEALTLQKPIVIEFDPVIRFDDGNGVLLPAKENCYTFHALRAAVLKGVVDEPRKDLPHITLMHPRNATCTDDIFNTITTYSFPKQLRFDTISLIEQQTGGSWEILRRWRK